MSVATGFLITKSSFPGTRHSMSENFGINLSDPHYLYINYPCFFFRTFQRIHLWYDRRSRYIVQYWNCGSWVTALTTATMGKNQSMYIRVNLNYTEPLNLGSTTYSYSIEGPYHFWRIKHDEIGSDNYQNMYWGIYSFGSGNVSTTTYNNNAKGKHLYLLESTSSYSGWTTGNYSALASGRGGLNSSSLQITPGNTNNLTASIFSNLKNY